MANLGYEQTSGAFQGEMANEKLATKKAERMKLMQEVYDLSINNELQAMRAKEETSPLWQTTRQLGQREAQAKANENIAMSLLTMDDIKIERMQKGIAALEQNPNPAVYKQLRTMFALSEPYLGELLPEEYGPEAMKLLGTVNDAAIMSKKHRQQLSQIGVQADQQSRLQKEKAVQNMDLSAAKFKQQKEILSRQIDHDIATTDIKEQGALKRARLAAAGEFENMAVEYENQGKYDKAAEVRLQAMKYAQMKVELAKLKASLTGAPKPNDELKYTETLKKNIDDNLKHDASMYDEAGGWNPDTKTLSGDGLDDVKNRLLQKVPGSVPDREKATWVSERILVDDGQWKDLPLTSSGKPAFGLKASDIKGWVGRTVHTLGPLSVPERLQEVDNYSDALKLYKWVLGNASPDNRIYW